MKNNTIRLILRVILSVALVAAGICLMAACLTLYRAGGEEPYSAQSVAKYWQKIAPVVYFALAMVVGTFVAEAVFPAEKTRRPVEKNYPLMLQKLHEKNDLSGCGDAKLVAAITAQQKKRKLHSFITLALLAIGFVVMLCYCLDSNHVYSRTETTQKMIGVSIVMLICFGVPFGYGIFTAYFHKASVIRELELMKLVASPRKEPLPAQKPAPKYMAYLPYVGIALAVVLIVVGVLGDGHEGVLSKAVAICKECVGIG